MRKQITMGDMQFNGTPEEWDALVKKNKQKTTKLYTEEQVRKLLKKAFWQDFYEDDTEDSLINELTPIELPTDEEIDIYVKSHKYDDMFENLLEYGAKWMRDKILNK